MWLAVLGPDRARLLEALLPWGASFVALAHLWLRHRPWLGRPGVLVAGILLSRAVFLPTLPDLSDDLFRYVWDGWLGVQGTPPYRFVPSDAALSHLHGDLLFREMNSPAYHSIYPPLSQLVFLSGGAVHAAAGWPLSGWTVKVAFLVLETSGCLLLLRALRRTAGDPAPLALYALNPLVLVTVAGGGHTEGALVAAFGLLLFGIAARSPALTWLGWVLAVLTKGFPIVLAPLIWRELCTSHGRREVALTALPALAVALALGALFLRPGDASRIASSAALYVQLFEFNPALYGTVRDALRLTTGHDFGRQLGPLLQAVFLAGAGWLALRHPVGDVVRTSRGILKIHTLFLVTATTVHPWYLLWVLPLIPFGTELRRPWLWASAAALPTYLVYVVVPAPPLTALFWAGWAILFADEHREAVLAPLRRLAAARKVRWIARGLGDRDPRAAGGASVLDVGGAEGHVTRRLRRLGWSAVLADPGARAGLPVPAVRSVGERLPFPDRSVDAVVLCFVLHHAGDPDRALREAFRVARRRVVIVESVFEGAVERRVLERLDRWANAHRGDGRMGRDAAPLGHRRAAEWRSAVEAAGGRVLEARRPNRIGHRVLLLVAEPRRG